MVKYKASTLSLAHGVLRRNLRLDLMLGSLIKQLTGMRSARPSQPQCSNSVVTIASSVMPWSGLLAWLFGVVMVLDYTVTGKAGWA